MKENWWRSELAKTDDKTTDSETALMEGTVTYVGAVSYTHLTLPTNREV